MLRPHHSADPNCGHSELGAQSGRKNQPACLSVCHTSAQAHRAKTTKRIVKRVHFPRVATCSFSGLENAAKIGRRQILTRALNSDKMRMEKLPASCCIPGTTLAPWSKVVRNYVHTPLCPGLSLRNIVIIQIALRLSSVHSLRSF